MLAAGAPGSGKKGAGAAYLFGYGESTKVYSVIHTFAGPDTANAAFGSALAMTESGAEVAVGAPGSGQVFLFAGPGVANSSNAPSAPWVSHGVVDGSQDTVDPPQTVDLFGEYWTFAALNSLLTTLCRLCDCIERTVR